MNRPVVPPDPWKSDDRRAPLCSPLSGCITCSDEGSPMRVVRVVEADIARCEDAAGALHDVLIGVVDDVSAGDLLLVHAGTALLRLPEGDGVGA